MTTFSTPQAIQVYRAIVIKHALLLYARTGMKVNSEYTPKNMIAAAQEITGKKFKARQYTEAAAALEEFIKSNSAPKEETPT
jgi:hypothetical protein